MSAPIVEAAKLQQLDDAAVALRLSPEGVAALETSLRPRPAVVGLW